ncbi:Type IV leader peptidase family protein [Thalassoglobus neptunius]|uniref:Type IV leader peptidase family protein n=1 Tax=Thalassoglobus neptunius TaxID=1938619 RepID=A0A5C5W823_9PLAN|nr:prepilin peptidase [Thalassoglobus neptunius]TWT47048.1 Type IV leader peptidase family protein [Thalassoglobus neptunius]
MSVLQAINDFGVLSFPVWLWAVMGGMATGVLTFIGVRRSLKDFGLPFDRWPLISSIANGLLGAALVVCVLGFQSQSTPEVIPSEAGRNLRLIGHLALVVLLMMISVTDLRTYSILDWNCKLGILLGTGLAFLSGDTQLAHLWVDWNQEVPQLRGPYLPEWLSAHPHLHGLVWSVVGVLTGGILAWGTRSISARLLGQPALGSGDILLMGMIGAFLGWQPTLIAYVLAPVLALVIGLIIQVTSNRPAIPYGPFLALGAVVVLIAWRSIWMLEIPLTLAENPGRGSIFAMRRFFGDPVSMAITAGLSMGLLIFMLALLRYYKSLSFVDEKSE